MAGVKKIVEYDVIINGVHELVRDVSQVEDRIKKMKTEISNLNKQERDAGTAQEKARIMDVIKQREEELKVLTATRREMRAAQGDLAAITEKMAQMGGVIPINELKKFKKELTTQLDVAKVSGDIKSFELIRDVLSQINKELIERDKIAKATSTQVNDDDMRKNAEAVLARVQEYNRTSKGTVIENVASPESRKQLQDAIAYYEKLKSSFREMSPEAEKVQAIIDVLSADLNKYKDNVKRAAEEMEEFKRAAIMKSASLGYNFYEDEKGYRQEYSKEELTAAIKATEKLRDATVQSDAKYKEYDTTLTKIEERFRKIAEAEKEAAEAKKLSDSRRDAADTMSNIGGSSVDKVKEAIEVTKKLRDEQAVNTREWRMYQRQIEEAEKSLKHYQEVADHKQLGESRVESMGRYVKTATADELRNDIKVLEQWRDSINAGDAAWDGVNEKLNMTRQALTAYEEKVKSSMMAADGYKGVAGTFADLSKANDGVVVSTKNLKRAEEELKKELKDNNLSEQDRVDTSKKLATVQQELARREKVLAEQSEQVKRNAAGYDGWKKTIDDTNSSVEKLRIAQKELGELIEKSSPNSREYKEYSKALATIKERLSEVNGALKEQGNWFVNAAKRFAKYAATWLNFYQLRDALINVTRKVYELSDSIADIQKVTKMSAEDVDRLSLAINRLDTRSSVEQLHKLGYQAGLLGLTSQNDILGFVKAADQMNWALKELGEDGAVNLMKVANLTHETEKYGVEGALKKIGSAINEITANSAASAGPVTEIVSRLGAVGSVAGYASAELVAIGSTMNALGVKSEMGATAVNKIMIALNNNLPAIALHSGLVADELKKLKDDTDALYAKGESNMTGAMAVMMAVLQKLHETSEASGNTLATLQPIFKDMGKEGTRLATTLTNLVDNVDTLGEHLDITSSAFDEGVSMLNEYNVKNETAAALLDRLKNALVETFFNSGTTRWLQSILKEMVKVVNHTGFWYRALVSLGTILGAIGTWKFVVFLKDSVLWLGNAAIATNTWAKSLVASYITRAGGTIKTTADTAANVANTASVTGNTVARYTNTAATEEGIVASVEQTAANEAQTVSWAQLAAAMWACPFTWMAAAVIAVIAAVAALSVGIAYLCGAFEKQSEMQKAVNRASDEASASMIEEKVEAERLFTSLESLVEQEKKYEDELKNAKKDTDAAKEAEEKLHRTQQDRVKITNTINEKYPQYIGYLSTEKLRLDDVRDAAHAVNVELERKGQLMIRDAQLEAMQGSLKDSFVSFNDEVGKELRELTVNQGLTEEQRRMFEAHIKTYMSSLIQSGNSADAIYGWTRWEARNYALSHGWKTDSEAYRDIIGNNTKYYNNTKVFDDIDWYDIYYKLVEVVGAVNESVTIAKGIEQSYQERTEKLNKDQAQRDGMYEINAQYKLMQDSYNSMQKAADGGKQKFAEKGTGAYGRLKELQDNYYSYLTTEQKAQFDNMLSQADKWNAAMMKYVGGASAAMEVVTNNFGHQLGGWADWSDQELVDKWKQLTTDMNNVRAGSKEIAARFGKEFGQQLNETSAGLEKARDMYHDRIKEVYAEMQKRDLTAQGVVNYKDPKGNKKHYIWVNGIPMTEGDIKKEVDAGKAALEAYYKDQEEKIDAAYLKGSLGSEQDRKNALDRLKLRKENSFMQFYDKLLHGSNSTLGFSEKAYGDFMKKRDFHGNLTDQYKDLNTLSEFVNQLGDGMQDGLNKNFETASSNIQKIQVQHMNALQKILLQYDYEGTVDEQYKSKLSEAELFWSNMEEVNAEGSRADAEYRIQLFKNLSDEIIGMDADMLRKRMENDADFADWTKGRTQSDYDALLVLLRDYHDNLIEAEKKYETRQKKIVDQEWDDRIISQDRIKRIQDTNRKMLSGLASEGLVDNSTVTRYEIEHLEQRKAYQEEYVAELRARGAATKEADAALTSLKESLEEKQNELRKQMRDTVKEYAGMFTEMMNTMATAANNHAALTSLAEIAAKRRLGIAVDETKKEYMIYSRNGKAIRKMMTDEEKLRWDIQNDARNKQLDAVNEWMQKMGEKMSEDLTLAVSNRLVVETQEREQREQMERLHEATDAAVNEEQRKADAVNSAEVVLTGQIVAQIQERYNAFVKGQRDEVEAMREAAKEKANIAAGKIEPNNPQPKSPGNGGTGIASGSVPTTGAASDAPMTNGTQMKSYEQYAAPENAGVAGSDYMVGDMMDRTLGVATVVAERIKDVNTTMCKSTLESHKAMTESQQRMVASMISSMNLYGIAYSAVMNDSLSTAQRVGVATLQAVGQVAMSLLSTTMAQVVGGVAADEANAIAKAFSQLGPIGGAAAIGGITAAIGAGLAIATKKITKSKQEIAAVTGASSGKKVAAGMLTYAEGNYPVLGSDGEVYDAKRETNWKTKVYSSPHYGILGEKGPELIVDGVTTRKMMTLRPDLYQDILDLARGRQAVRAKAYAEGNYPAMPAVNGGGGDDTNAMLVAAISQLNAQLAGGIKVAALGEDGAVRRLNEAEDWMRKHGLA